MFADLIAQVLRKPANEERRTYPKRIAAENDKSHVQIGHAHFVHINFGTPAEMRRGGILHRQIRRILQGRPWRDRDTLMCAVFHETARVNPDRFDKIRDMFYGSDAFFGEDEI